VSGVVAVSTGERGRRLIGAALRFVWFGVMPALLSVVVLRYLVPSVVRAPEGALKELSQWAETRQPLLAVGSFLSFSAVLRYWRGLLPGAPLWAEPVVAVRPSGAKNGVLWLGLCAVAGLLAFTVRGSLFQSYRVLSGSMLPTLQPGEVLLSKQYAYGLRWPWSKPGAPTLPRRGDVVVFRRPPLRPDVPEELVKRVIGLPGDTISTFAGYAFINGWQIPTCDVGPYVFISGDGMLEAMLFMEFLDDQVYLTAHAPAVPEHSEPYTVKPGEVFVLGDNRNNSSDSRAWNDGHGGGLGLAEIRGKLERFLWGQHRDGAADLSLWFQHVGTDVHAEGIDNADLREGVDRCLKNRPKRTRPPAPHAGTDAAPTAGAVR
jgi:signal peptidase I